MNVYISNLQSDSKISQIQRPKLKYLLPKSLEPNSIENQNSLTLLRKYKCTICHKQFKTKRGSFIHKLSHKEKTNFAHLYCKICTRQFHSETSFIKHNQKHLDSICYYCNSGFLSKTNAIAHIAKMHNDDKFQKFVCICCDLAYATRIILLRHYRIVHKTKSILVCGECVSLKSNNKLINFDSVETLTKHISEKHESKTIVDHFLYQDTTTKENDASIEALSLYADDVMHAEFLNYNLLGDEDYLNSTSNKMSMVEEFLEDAFQMAHTNDNSINMSELDLILLHNNNPPEVHSNLVHESSLANEDISENNYITLKHKTKDNTDKYKCPKCNDMFVKQQELKLHLAHHHNEMVLMCNECGASFNKMVTLDNHRREHKKENRIANESLSTFFQLNQVGDNFEISTEENGSLKYICKFCRKKYTRKSSCEQHDCSNNKTPYECNDCKQMFETPKDLFAHRKLHVSDTLYCSLCDKNFTTIAGLKYHLNTHTGVKAFSCPFCIKKFTANVNLNAHIRIVHSTLKPHKCEQCAQTFAAINHLKRHITSIHHKERKYICSVCSKSFLQQSHLTQHLWIHTGVKPYPCEQCTNSYTSKLPLKKHIVSTHNTTKL